MTNATGWITVGKTQDLIPGSGVGAAVAGHQLALFWMPELDNRLFAVSNYCPFSRANIIARGIPGDIGGEPVVASPLYKQHFSLVDGRCIEQPEIALSTWNVRLEDDAIQVQTTAAKDSA